MDLVDLPASGMKLTCFKLARDSMSHLYHSVISEGFIDTGGLKGQFIDKHNVSDHFHISIKSSKLIWGLKPFKFILAWLEHPGFLPLVDEICAFS